MKIPEIRALCIKASEIYYDYLEENNKGISRIEIRKIDTIDNSKFKLKLSKKIFDEEAISLTHLPSKKDWGIQYLHTQVYDKDSNTLIIKPDSVIADLMRRSRADDWELISDLKFLVERVRQWYQKNGTDIQIPKNTSKLDPPPNKLYFKEKDLNPSEEQKKALEYIFTKPLTYIWGAPGTGKTQFVLSYAILHYLSKGKKVGIMAPTNHALEQIFRGVIKMTDKAGISRDKILRLGGPSKKFADEYPEVCEILGLEKQLHEVQKQIDTLEKLLGMDDASNEIKLLESALNGIESLSNEKAKLPPVESEISQLKVEREDYEKNLRAKELKIESSKQEIDRLQRKKHSTFYRITKAFTGSQNLTQNIRNLEWVIVESESACRKDTEKISVVQKNIDHLGELKLALERKLEKLKDTIRISLKGTRFKALDKLSSMDLGAIKLDIQSSIDEIQDEQPTYDSLFKEYEMHDPAYLKQKLKKLFDEKDRLLKYSTEERLKNISILGATLDTYLYRFQDDKLGVDHIFLDEAGYSNIIKAQTLFNQGIPVTFLGDHKQLPPVCELSKRNIQRDEKYRPVLVWDQSALYLEDLYALDSLDTICLRYLSSMEATFNLLQKHSLTSTFRFGNSLARVLEKFVYPDGFESALDTETEIILYNAANPGYNQNGTRKNQAEVDAITQLLRQNYDAEKSDVAVLAPYNLQVRELMRNLPDFHNQNKLMTVHKSQGQEWDTIVYSVCDIGNGKRPWFTDSSNHMSNGLNNINTAVSRAKKTLIIVCNEEEWKFFPDQLITGILQVATKKISV